MGPAHVRTIAFIAAGLLLSVQFVLNQYGQPFQPSGVILLFAALIFLGLGVVRIRNPGPAGASSGYGIVDFLLVTFVVVLAVITTGLGALVLT